MRLTVIGCSPAWPNPGAAQSGYLVEGSGRLLVDCGPGVLSRLRENEAWPRIDAIAISHLHLDHVADLTAWLWGALMGPGRGAPKPQLWVPHGARFDDPLEDAFDLHEYTAREPFEAAGFTITAIPTRHAALPHGFRISDGQKTLAYSGDSGPTPELAELADGADLFLCEATQADDEPAELHLTAREAIAVGAKRLLLTHRPAELPPADAIVAHDGLTIDV
ncbi:MAG TPA: MBL fold metallo-hydrolase [Gaiellaceae bacterium]|nr:MBL fold metallo-hydrolase [Gaiellaceae bacterium]